MIAPTQLDRYDDGAALVSFIYATDKNTFEVGVAHPLYNDNHVIIVYCGENKAMGQSVFNQYRDMFLAGNFPQFIQEQDTGFLALFANMVDRRHYKNKINSGMG